MLARVLLAIAGIGLTTLSYASQPPKVGYSADSSIESAEGTMSGPFYYMPGKERREYIEDGEKMAMIIRHDKKIIWMLMPEDKMYMEMSIPKEGRKDDIGNWKTEQTTVGPDTVNGIKTTKSKIIMTGPKGEKLGGFWWNTKENITVKIDAISVEKNSKERFKIELTNLKVGKQDAALFEIPSGYSKMGMGAMMMGGDDDDDKPAAKKGKSEEGGFGLKDALKMF